MPVAQAANVNPAVLVGPATSMRPARPARRGKRTARRSARLRTSWPLTSQPLRYPVESLDHWLDLNA
jgi:hypothetical protein